MKFFSRKTRRDARIRTVCRTTSMTVRDSGRASLRASRVTIYAKFRSLLNN